ncbi:hypothetical protein E5082_30330 [Streptomyces griseoluteus]|uniref:Uncharacterized protein n=1 Tax=Streptomyces griseoluteus TaxID=29306 RepID=A0A4Z1CYY9_STRGP|nr:hypothetical protein E5082_30330 [Streptomyces griseoluteus]
MVAGKRVVGRRSTAVLGLAGNRRPAEGATAAATEGFDYVVVGAWAGGAPLAARLARAGMRVRRPTRSRA